MNTQKYEDAVDKTFNTVNTVYSAGRRIGYVLMGLVFLVAGIGLAGWGYVTVKNKLDGTNYVKTEGTVLSLREVESTENSDVTWVPIIKFTDKSGVEHTFESTVSSDPPAYKVGDKVELLYPEGRPDDVFINSWVEKWLTPVLLGFAGLVMFCCSIWMIFTAFRREKPSKYSSNSSTDGSASYVSMG